MSVCEVLPKLGSYRGKMVALRGRLYVGEEVFFLKGVDCPRTFVTDGHKWPPAIDLTGSDERIPSGERPIQFDTEEDAAKKLHEISQKARSGREVWVTVIGQLRVRKKYVPVHTNYGILWNGYGHLGVYPAQLVIRTLKDVAVK